MNGMNLHLHFRWVFILLFFFLFSCSDENAEKELQSEYDYIKENTPKQAAKPEYTGPAFDFVPPEDYELFDRPYATETTEQVVVYEFFGYACPHCFHFQPYMEKWLENKPDYVKFIRVPLNFQPNWEVLQKAYLTAELMGVVEQSHIRLFKEIHENHTRFSSIEQLAQWYSDEFEINKQEFLSTAESFILDSKQRKADKMGFEMQVTSTPTVIVNGKLRASKKVRDRDHFMKVINYLIKKEAEEMGLIEKK